jgi:hypothetical protein
MTSVAKLGLCRNEEVLRLFGFVRRVAVQAANIVARVRRCREVSLFVILTVTTQAAGVRILLRHRLETNDLGYVPSAFHVGGSRTMTGFAAVPIVQGGLEVWSVFEIVLVQVLMAGLAGINTHILPRRLVGRCSVFFLRAGKKR